MCTLNREWYGTEHPIKSTPHVKKVKELLEIEHWVPIIFSGIILRSEQTNEF